MGHFLINFLFEGSTNSGSLGLGGTSEQSQSGDSNVQLLSRSQRDETRRRRMKEVKVEFTFGFCTYVRFVLQNFIKKRRVRVTLISTYRENRK